jgi:hypothetical protein
MKKQYNLFIFVLLLFFAVLSSCKYDNIVEPAPPSPTDSVSFSQQIQPIFNSNCVSCHKAGAQAPDLSAGTAYTSIMNANLVNTASPESSIIYWHPNPDNTSAHTWEKYTANQAALVLIWIQQGAKDN